MKNKKMRKLFLITFVMVLSIFVLTGCGNDGGSNLIDDSIGTGYVEGYIYETTDGQYVFDKENGENPVTNAQIELNGQIYNTNNEGYFKSSALDAGTIFTLNIVVPKENDSDFAWSTSFKVKDKQTLNISSLSIKKDWNIILFMSDKSDSLDSAVSYFMDTLEDFNDMKKVNLFIIHGKYLIELKEDDNGDIIEVSSEETNKSYYITGNGKKEVFDYGYENFGDPMFYREEILKINERYPANKTMVTIFSHGSGWQYMEKPPENPNAMAADHAYYDRMYNEEEGTSATDYALEVYEIYEIFNGIGFDIDLFNFAACHMGEVEVIEGLPSNVKYAMASPSFGYTTDINVHRNLVNYINNDNLDAVELGKKYIDNYVERLRGGNYASVKALYDMSGYRTFVDSFTDLTGELEQFFLDNPDKISTFQDEVLANNITVQSYYNDADGAVDPTRVGNKDLLGLLGYLKNNSSKYNAVIANKALDSYDLLENVLLYSKYSEGSEGLLLYDGVEKEQDKYTYKNSNGLSIFVHSDSNYKDTWFAQKTGWNRVLDQVAYSAF